MVSGGGDIRRRLARIEDSRVRRPDATGRWSLTAGTAGWLLLITFMGALRWWPAEEGVGLHWSVRALVFGLITTLGVSGSMILTNLRSRQGRRPAGAWDEGITGVCRQTVADCVGRIEREWEDVQFIFGSTGRAFEPILLLVLILATTVGLWFAAVPPGGLPHEPAEASRHTVTVTRSTIDDLRRP